VGLPPPRFTGRSQPRLPPAAGTLLTGPFRCVHRAAVAVSGLVNALLSIRWPVMLKRTWWEIRRLLIRKPKKRTVFMLAIPFRQTLILLISANQRS